jgi:hypothetical protein
VDIPENSVPDKIYKGRTSGLRTYFTILVIYHSVQDLLPFRIPSKNVKNKTKNAYKVLIGKPEGTRSLGQY